MKILCRIFGHDWVLNCNTGNYYWKCTRCKATKEDKGGIDAQKEADRRGS